MKWLENKLNITVFLNEDINLERIPKNVQRRKIY